MDASGHVASYSKGLVESKNGLVVGTNSPTREFDAEHAYVVNISELLTAEAQDIITFEQNTLGLTGHASAEEYALQKLPIGTSMLKGSTRVIRQELASTSVALVVQIMPTSMLCW